MNEREWAQLRAPLDEFKAVRSWIENCNDGPLLDDLRQAAVHLEATYVMRLYAAFESILRRRAGITSDEGKLVELIRRLVQEREMPDPVPPHSSISYWQLFRRDRNALMHGNATFPLLSVGQTFMQMEIFLRNVAPALNP